MTLQLERGATLHVRVCDQKTRTPLSGVAIHLRTPISVVARDAGAVIGVTDEDGMCICELPEKWPDSWQLVVSKRGYAAVSVYRQTRPRELSVALDRGSAVEGQVMDASSGVPVAGVNVVAYAAGDRGAHSSSPLGVTGQTDALGEFTLCDVANDAQVTVMAYENDRKASAAVTDRSKNVVLRLEGEKGWRRVRMRVSDEKGKPVSGVVARLRVCAPDRGYENAIGEESMVGDDGVVAFRIQDGVSIKVRAFARGSGWIGVSKAVDLPDWNGLRTMTVERTISIRGRAVPLMGKLPMVSLWVRDRGILGKVEDSSLSEDGRFGVEGPLGMRMAVVMHGAGIAPTVVNLGRIDEHETPGGIYDMGSVVIRRAASVSGVVKDVSGMPVGGATVTWNRSREWTQYLGDVQFSTVSGPNGAFELKGLPWEVVTISAVLGSRRTGEGLKRGEVEVEAGAKDVVLQFHQG